MHGLELSIQSLDAVYDSYLHGAGFGSFKQADTIDSIDYNDVRSANIAYETGGSLFKINLIENELKVLHISLDPGYITAHIGRCASIESAAKCFDRFEHKFSIHFLPEAFFCKAEEAEQKQMAECKDRAHNYILLYDRCLSARSR